MPAGATSNMQRRVPKTTSDRVIAPQGAGCQKLASRPAEGRVFFLDIPFIEPHFCTRFRGQIDPQGRSSPTGSFLRCAARIWAKGVKKVGITYFSFVFTTFFTLSCA